METQGINETVRYSRIVNSCSLANKQGLRYIWIDTFCIDRSSSAEVSEAINLMYRWYMNAQVCYAYFSDISLSTIISKAQKRFVDSRWFKRGWTLQEPLAPSSVIFFDQEWREIGTKNSLERQISSATGIDPQYFYGNDGPRSASIAAKMSWASSRETTRPEDMAYCLLGIFKVNMPLLYGEGDNAFQRLQRKLIKKGGDESIFASTIPFYQCVIYELNGMLARSPASFATSGNIVPIDLPDLRQATPSVTSGGLRMTLAFKRRDPHAGLDGMTCYEVPLACADAEDNRKPVVLYLYRSSDGSLLRRGDTTSQFGKLQSDYKTDTFNIDHGGHHSRIGVRGMAPRKLHHRLRLREFRRRSQTLLTNQLTPTAYKYLRLIDSEKKSGRLDINEIEREYEWRRPPASRHRLLLKFQYDEERFIDLLRRDDLATWHKENYRAPIGLRVRGQEQSLRGLHNSRFAWNTSDDDLAATSSSTEDNAKISSTSNKTSAKNTEDEQEGEGEGEGEGEKQDKESVRGFTFLEVEDRYSIQLEEGKYLWVGQKKISSKSLINPVLIEIDVSSFDRANIL